MENKKTPTREAVSPSRPMICSTADWENQTSSLTHEVWDGEKWVEEPLTNAQAQELMAEMLKPDSGAIFQIRDGNE